MPSDPDKFDQQHDALKALREFICLKVTALETKIDLHLKLNQIALD